MSINEAAASLQSHLSRFPWFTTVGIGREQEQDILIVFASSLKASELKALKANGWKGFPVVPEKMGAPRPIPA